jgi:hypothetical protein
MSLSGYNYNNESSELRRYLLMLLRFLNFLLPQLAYTVVILVLGGNRASSVRTQDCMFGGG